MARFFKTPIHYQGNRKIYSLNGAIRTEVPNVNDNDYRTYSTESSYIVQTHGAQLTDETIVNWAFIKNSGVSSYSISVPSGKGSGDGITNRSIQSTVQSFDKSNVSTTVNGIQNELVSLSSAITVVNNQSLRRSPSTIANDLSSITNAVSLRVQLTNATLSSSSTPGTVEIVGDNPAGTEVTQTLSFSNTELLDPKTTTQQYISVSAINLTGFSAGSITITYNARLSCSEAQLDFTGTNIRIYEIMLLEEALYLHPEKYFLDYRANLEDNSFLRQSINGQYRRIRSLSSRPKWNIEARVLFDLLKPTNQEDFLNFSNNNRNFVFEEEYTSYPDRVYPATWASNNSTHNFYTRMKSAGIVTNFSIQEQ